MKYFRVTLLFLTTSLLFVPQHLPKTPPMPSVKSASIHQVTSPRQVTLGNPNISAKAVYVLDVTSNTVIYQKNPQKPLFPASLTKIMTAMVALDYYPEDQVLTVKSADHSIGNTMSLKPGDSLTAIDLIYGLLVASGNDAALTLAENFPGGYSQFIIAMNQKAQALGLKDTRFNNVSGVEDINHLSTAYDLTKLTQAALKNVTFRRIVGTSRKEVVSLNKHSYSLVSTNKLLGVIPSVQGVKTGWTPEAGECLITLVNQSNHPIIITILGSEDRFKETEEIINWVYNNFSWL